MTPSSNLIRAGDRDAAVSSQREDARVARAVEEYLALLEAGERPDRWEFLARYSDVADVLADCLDGLEFVRAAAGQLSGPQVVAGADALAGSPAPLGDYRIIREVGRGGMGVVYEAEQLSLRRRVALKVLPFAAIMDPRRLKRFQNEAAAAAGLDHPHVVKVYAVGEERGVHYIAMQFVEGQTLADLIRERRDGPTESMGLLGGQEPTRTLAPDATPDSPVRREGRPAAASGSTSRTGVDDAYARRVAGWGIQAAEALEHAHALGVVHRDVKPGNMLVDGRGELFVADFGLAKLSTDPGATGTGDVLGTLRYMSPEQASAKHGLVDHRSDVYSLGVTLYELLTLTPAFGGDNRQHVLSQIISDEPTAPRKLDRQSPPDLETIVLKAMAKEPERRYQTAKELADDLQRFLAHEPVRAKRATVRDRLAKWARRHRSAVGAAVAGAALTVAALAVGMVLVLHESKQKEKALKDAHDNRERAERGEQDARRWVALEAEQRQAAEANWKGALRAETHLRKWAEHLKSVGNDRGAAEVYTQSVEILTVAADKLPDQPGYRRQLYHHAFSLADELFRSHQHDKAAAAWERAARLAQDRLAFPADEEDSVLPIARDTLVLNALQALSIAGSQFLELGQHKKAELLLREALGLPGKYAEELKDELPEFVEMFRLDAEASLGIVLAETNRHAEALALYDAALARVRKIKPTDAGNLVFNPVLARTLQCRADLLLERGRLAEAAAGYREARALFEAPLRPAKGPGFPHKLAWLLAMCPHPACRDAKRAAELAKDTDVRALTAALYRAGDIPGAAAAAKKWVPTSTDHAGRFLKVMVLARNGNFKLARSVFTTADQALQKARPGSYELRLLRTEAAEVLATLDPPQPKALP